MKIFHQIWYTDGYWPYKGYVAQYPAFGKIRYGGGCHLECSIYGHTSVVNIDILVKFCTLIDIGHTRVSVAQYLTFGNIQHGGGRHLEFSIFWPYLRHK